MLEAGLASVAGGPLAECILSGLGRFVPGPQKAGSVAGESESVKHMEAKMAHHPLLPEQKEMFRMEIAAREVGKWPTESLQLPASAAAWRRRTA